MHRLYDIRSLLTISITSGGQHVLHGKGPQGRVGRLRQAFCITRYTYTAEWSTQGQKTLKVQTEFARKISMTFP